MKIFILGLALIFSSQCFANSYDLISVKTVQADRTLVDTGRDVDIQAQLRIVPNKARIFREAASLVSPGTEKLAKEFSDNQALIMGLIEDSNELAARYVKLDLTANIPNLQSNPDFIKYNELKTQFFTDLNSLMETEIHPGLENELEVIFGPDNSSDGPNPEAEFLGIIRILSSTLDKLASNLQKQFEGKVALEVKAFHLTQTNQRVLIGPSPYVDIDQCIPSPSKRFEILPSDSAQHEFEFARQIAPVANDIISGAFKEQVKIQLAVLKEKGRELEKAVKTELLDKIVSDIKQIDIAAAADRKKAGTLVNSIERLNQNLSNLKLTLRSFDTDRLALLNNFSASINNISTEVALIARELPGQIKDIEKNLEDIAQGTLGNVEKDIEDFIADLTQQVINTDVVTNYFKEVAQIAKTYKAMTTIRDAGANINAKINKISVNKLVDASLALDELCQPRNSGDKIIIEARLFNGDGSVIAHPPNRVYKLRDLNWHVTTRGFLAFAHPEKSSKVTTQQDYQAVPAIAWYFKKDKPNNDTYNDLWSPGYGFTTMAMNFNDNDSFELGLGVSFSFFRDLLHVSYGWNIQTDSEFYSIGINPLVFEELFRK